MLFLKKYLINFCLLLTITVSGFFYAHNLDHSYLTLWDEAVHVNVIKNLSKNCCVPTLLPEKLDTDFRNWTDNYVWLHKPVLPFYISAAAYSLFGKSLFAIRLPAAIAAELIGLVLFWLGKKYFGARAGLLATVIFLCNNYTFELVQGRQFSGLPDLLFALFCLFGLACVLHIIESPTDRKAYFLFGLTMAAGFYSKGGLVLIPFGILALVLLMYHRTLRSVANYAQAALMFLLFVIPSIFYLAHRFPAEFAYEQSVQAAHAFANVEHWARPFDFYLTTYSFGLFGALLVFPVLVGSLYGLRSYRRNPKLFAVALWMVAFFGVVSLMVSKISNFAYAAVPVGCLLAGVVVIEWWNNRQWWPVFGIGVTGVITYLVFHFAPKDIQAVVGVDVVLVQRFIPLIVSNVVGVMVLTTSWILRNKITRQVAFGAGTFGLVVLIFVSARTNWIASNFVPPTAAIQNSVRETADKLNHKLPEGSIVLTNVPELDKSNLFYLYWSNFSALEVYQYHPVSFLLKRLPKDRPVYLVSSMRLNGYKLMEEVPVGYVYKLR